MKIQFVLSEKNNINSFVYCLNLLYGNFTEALFSFSKNGLSISQFWEDKNTDRGKYLIYFDASFFSKITCQNTEKMLFKINLKEILQKLKSHKKDIQEIFIKVRNERRDGEIDPGWCLVEFMIMLDSFGSLVYRNCFQIEREIREGFKPLEYYQYIQNQKQPLFIVEPDKLDFLSSFKNEFVEMYMNQENVELTGSANKQKISINPNSCFKSYNLEKFREINEGANTLMNPPHHLQRYTDVCNKSNRDMAIYVSNKASEDGNVKLYCPVKAENYYFLLKFKMKMCENRPDYLSSNPTGSVLNRVANGLGTSSQSGNMHPSLSNVISAVRNSNSMDIEAIPASYPQLGTPSVMPMSHSNSNPNFNASEQPFDRISGNGIGKKIKRHDYQLSQEEIKKVKKNDFEKDEKQVPVRIRLDKQHIVEEFSSRAPSSHNTQAMEIQTTKGPIVTKFTDYSYTKQEHMEESPDYRPTRLYKAASRDKESVSREKESVGREKESVNREKESIRKGHGQDRNQRLASVPKSEHVIPSTMSTENKRSIFDNTRATSFAAVTSNRAQTNVFIKPESHTRQLVESNDGFAKNLNRSLRNIKL